MDINCLLTASTLYRHIVSQIIHVAYDYCCESFISNKTERKKKIGIVYKNLLEKAVSTKKW